MSKSETLGSELNNFDIYVQSYVDLALWFTTSRDIVALQDHFVNISPREQRVLPQISQVPVDWSDELYLGKAALMAQTLWSLGILSTLFYHAQVEFPDSFPSLGFIRSSQEIMTLTDLTAESLAQASEFEKTNLGSGIVSAARKGTMDWDWPA